MKTTLDLPDSLYRHLKVMAASEGRTLTEVIRDCLRKGLDAIRNPAARKKTPYRLPVVESKHPGTLNLTNDMINELLDDDLPKNMFRK